MTKDMYIGFPVDFEKIADPNSTTGFCPELFSIQQFLRLVLQTAKGNFKGDKNFGCNIKNMPYSEIYDSWNEVLDELKADVEYTVFNYEKRLVNVRVNIESLQRKQEVCELEVVISGQLVSTKNPFNWTGNLYLSA